MNTIFLRTGLSRLAVVTVFLSFPMSAQDVETDPAVLKKLDWFQDLKFGLLLHWGPYSQWGIVESWSLCPEDEPWCVRRDPKGLNHLSDDYHAYMKAYEQLGATFNPVRFEPRAWAAAAAGAGMRYLVFTTKHHDGFCMFDTKQTSYAITDPSCPFSTDPRRNITRGLFEAFREHGMGVGAYFSKPDWHSPDYWWPYFPPKDRNVNYAIEKYPRKWENFKEFTYRQIEELMTGYGSIDILWLDGGWVNPDNRGQDVDIPRIAAMARSHQPGLIVVDRAVPGRYENYRTPEQEVPDAPPNYVWETCMTMATSWSYVPDDTYKPAAKLIGLLVDIVAKGGNLLLNIGPSPAGELPPTAMDRLAEIGAWMKVNGGAIYATRPTAPYTEGNFRFTRTRDGLVNALWLADSAGLPSVLTIRSFRPRGGTEVRMLGVSHPLPWEPYRSGFRVRIPEETRLAPPCRHVWTLQFRPE